MDKVQDGRFSIETPLSQMKKSLCWIYPIIRKIFVRFHFCHASSLETEYMFPISSLFREKQSKFERPFLNIVTLSYLPLSHTDICFILPTVPEKFSSCETFSTQSRASYHYSSESCIWLLLLIVIRLAITDCYNSSGYCWSVSK